VAAAADHYAEFIPTITRSEAGPPSEGMDTVTLQLSLPILTFETRYGIRVSPTSVDMLGYDGDLKGSRLRWDVAPLPARGPGLSRLVLRTQQSLDRASLLLRQLYKLEPLFEHGVNLGLQLVMLRSIKGQAERALATRPDSTLIPPP
jgi:hypothetical protein